MGSMAMVASNRLNRPKPSVTVQRIPRREFPEIGEFVSQ